jgi:hypothetical protein
MSFSAYAAEQTPPYSDQTTVHVETLQARLLHALDAAENLNIDVLTLGILAVVLFVAWILPR